MTIRQVLLNGTGTSGDGTTWNDASDATSAYIKQAGLVAAVSASAAGDIVFVKGSDTTSTATITFNSTTLDKQQNPIQIRGCKSATTNNQGSIVTSDLIDGIRNGGAATAAYLDADVPVAQVNSTSSDINILTGHWYGIKLISGDNLALAGGCVVEECSLEVTGSFDDLQVGSSGALALVKTVNSRLKLQDSSGTFTLRGISYHFGTVISVPGAATGIINNISTGRNEFHGCDFTDGGETNIFLKSSNAFGGVIFNNCKFPASWALTGGTATTAYRVESYGSDDTSGLTTGGSEQAINIETQHGTIVTETTKVRTGGADDGADGLYSLDLSTFANGTALGVAGLSVKCAPIWVEGDGTSKNIEIYFTSDSGNTRGTDWNDDEVWGTVLYPDDAGTSQYDYLSSVANLLATGSAVTDDTSSTWGAGTQNDQKIVIAIAPDYEGYVIPEIHFAPGANAETIYADPLPLVA